MMTLRILLSQASWIARISFSTSSYLPSFKNVTVHTPLSCEVFWHEYAKILRHTSQNSIAAGNLGHLLEKVS